ncbi:hypothetical protein LEMLEM_LOCUS1962 [Lemmus lemmus]
MLGFLKAITIHETETGGSEEKGHPPIYGAFKTLAQDNNNNNYYYYKHLLLFIAVRVSWFGLDTLACIQALRRCHCSTKDLYPFGRWCSGLSYGEGRGLKSKA